MLHRRHAISKISFDADFDLYSSDFDLAEL